MYQLEQARAARRRPSNNKKADDAPGVLVVFVHQALHADPTLTVTELADEVKWVAARYHVPYDGARVSAAIAAALQGRAATRAAARRRPAPFQG